MTGDTLDPATWVMGGTLFGGPIGLVASLVSVIIEESTGQGPGRSPAGLVGGRRRGRCGRRGHRCRRNSAIRHRGRRHHGRPHRRDHPGRNQRTPHRGRPAAGSRQRTAHRTRHRNIRLSSPPAVQAFPSPGQASTDGRVPPPVGDGVLPWLADQAAAPAPPAPVTRPPSAPAPGQESQCAAVAPLGSWFSDVMLTALARYEEGAKLSDATAARGLNITN